MAEEKTFVWDGRTQRYRDKATGRFLRNETVLNIIQGNIQQKSNRLVGVLEDLLQGKITTGQFQRESLDTIKYLHVQQYLIGKGGFRRTTSQDYLQIARDLKDVHYPAFQGFIQDLQSGKLTEAQAKQRMRAFAIASNKSYHYGVKQSAVENGYRYAQRFLSAAEHCSDCPIYAALGVTDIRSLILPGEKCECRYNCKCYVRYYMDKP
jgi:hypothetical protein